MGGRNNHIIMNKYSYFTTLSIFLFLLFSCANVQKDPQDTKGEIVEVMPPKAMHEILRNDTDAQLVDVRTEEEYSVSHLKDAQNICVTDADFKERVATLDKQKPVYVYCKKGGRSAKAANILQEMGFTKIYDLQGGINEWEANKLQTTN